MSSGKKEVTKYDKRSFTAARAFALRLEGVPFEEIAVELNISMLEAHELVRIAYSKLSTQSAEEARAEVEERLNKLLRLATADLSMARSQSERSALYRILLSIERDRATLLGLDIPKGTPDA